MSSYKKKKTSTKSYQFKLQRNNQLNWFQALTTNAAEKLLEELWSVEWLTKLGNSNLKAYKVINEAQAQLEGIYLPSRVRRGVAEWVGRIIRGQYKRYRCYQDCIEIVNWLGGETKESKLIAVVMQHCRTIGKNGKTYTKYKKIMVQQTLAMIKNKNQRLGSGFANFAYTDHVQPKIKYYAFNFGPDDDQAIRYKVENQIINLEIKLPKTAEPRTRDDWEWLEQELFIPSKVQAKIAKALSTQPVKPSLREKTLKGGQNYFFLQFPWQYPKKSRKKRKERVLAIDLGLKKVAIVAVFEKGKQISRPITIKLKGSEYWHIERIYEHIAENQRQIAKQKKKRESKQVKVIRRGEKKTIREAKQIRRRTRTHNNKHPCENRS